MLVAISSIHTFPFCLFFICFASLNIRTLDSVCIVQHFCFSSPRVLSLHIIFNKESHLWTINTEVSTGKGKSSQDKQALSAGSDRWPHHTLRKLDICDCWITIPDRKGTESSAEVVEISLCTPKKEESGSYTLLASPWCPSGGRSNQSCSGWYGVTEECAVVFGG